jgi:hypothetical protein
VEANIIYMPVYPGDQDAEFNSSFFENAPNILTDIIPEAVRYVDIVRVFDLPAAAKGRSARVAADPNSRMAVCYLD